MVEPLVVNAADEGAIKEAGIKTKHRKERDQEDLRYLLQSSQGRRFVWKLLGFCNVHASIFNTNNSTQSYNAGKQDVGHFILGEVINSDESAYLKMMKEAKENKL